MSVTYSPLYGSDADDALSPTYTVDGDVVDVHSTIYGGGGNDVITGETISQKSRYAFFGEDGDDVLMFGSSKAKAYFSGGEGNDTIYVSGSLQSADGGAGDDIIDVIGQTKHVDGGEGYDTLRAFKMTISDENVSGFEKLAPKNKVYLDEVGLDTFDTLVVESAELHVSTQTDLSMIKVETTMDTMFTVFGSSYSDQLDGSGYLGYFEAFGGAGDDYIRGTDIGINARGEAGNDIIIGAAGSDTLRGGYDASEFNTVLGNGGDDEIYYGGGGGVINGGAGSDTLSLSSDKSGLHMGDVKITGMELWDLSEIQGTLCLDAFDVSVMRKITGNGRISLGENRVFRNVNFLESSVTLIGSEKADVVSITTRNDITVFGGGGDDHITDKAGMAAIFGDVGNDTLTGGNSFVSIRGGDGDDKIIGSSQRDYLYGDSGNDTVVAGGGNDRIYVNETTRTDRDIVDAGAGDDEIVLGNGALGSGRINGGDGRDTLIGKGVIGNYILTNVETLAVRGAVTADADTLNSFSDFQYDPDWTHKTWKLKFILSSGGEFTWKASSYFSDGTLVGSAEKDVIDFSKSATDWNFDLGKGDDIVTASLYDDTFRFKSGDGHDVIKKFDVQQDDLRIARSAEIRAFDDLEGRILTQGDNVLIVLDKTVSSKIEDMHDVIELTHIKASELASWNIQFFG